MSLIRSLPSPLIAPTQSPLAPPPLPWEAGGGGVGPTQLLSGLVTSLGGSWLDGRSGVSGGASASGWAAVAGSLSVLQSTPANQPAYAGNIVTPDGVNDFLVGATNPVSGATALTCDIVASSPGWAGGSPVFVSLGTFAGGAPRVLLYANGATDGISIFVEAPGATTNEWASGTTTMPLAVYTFQIDLSLGAAATVGVFKNGTLLGSRKTSGVCSGTFTNGSGIAIGAQNTTPSNPSNPSILGITFLPTVSAANNAQRIPWLRSIYGV